jgi:hypothetical protein
MRSALFAVLAVSASAVEGPYNLGGLGEFGALTDREKQAVGESLENALGVLSGKKKAGSMFDICSDMFSNGPPANKNDATWVACKDVLPSTGSLLAFKQAIVKQGGAKHPLSGSEKDAVGAALNKALGVMSGKIKGGSKYVTCMDMFPNGPPADAATSVTWASCKGELGYKKSALLSNSRELKTVKKVAEPDLRTLTGGEKAAVGAALENALNVLSGKAKSGDKFSICSNMFPNGAPTEGAKDPAWVSCKDSLPSVSAYGSLISWKQAVVAKGGAKHPLSEHEKTAVGDALGEALNVLSGKAKAGSKTSICSHMFPNGAPADAATSVTWKTCASTLR